MHGEYVPKIHTQGGRIMKLNELKVGSLLSYGQMAASILVTLIYTPLLIKFLGQSEYGLYNTVLSVMTMLSVLSLGFHSGYIKYYAKYKHQHDEISIYKLNGLMLIVFCMIGLIALCCGTFLTFNLKFVFGQGLSREELVIARMLMLILTINLTISFPTIVFSQIIAAHEKFIFLQSVQIFRTVVSPLLTVPLLYLGYGSVAIVVVTVLISFLMDMMFLYFVIFKLQNKFIFSHFEKGLFQSLFTYTSFIAINLIIDQINWNLDKVLLGRFCGTIAVSIYAVGSIIHACFQRFSTAISGVFTPRIHRIVASSDATKWAQLTNLFTKVGRIQFLILGLVATGFLFFGRSFIKLWAGNGFQEAYIVALLLILPVLIPLTQNLAIEIQRAQNKHQHRSIIYFFIALLNIILTLILCPKYGATGAALATAISMCMGEGLVLNIYYHKTCHINMFVFWKHILRLSLGLTVPMGMGILICRYVSLNTFSQFLIWSGLYAGCYILSMWVLGMNQYEKDLIKKPLQQLAHKLRRCNCVF